jgi:DNA uptake protein ComE-like DNA-binding protein
MFGIFIAKPSRMNPVRKYLRDAFGFSGNEINGFLILLPLIAFAIFSEPAYRAWLASRPRLYNSDRQHLDSLMAKGHFFTGMPVAIPPPDIVPFPFDPNTAAVGEFDSLGIPGVLANRIAAYRSKGGVFRIKSDLLKIYGLDSTLYRQLYPYILLPVAGDKASNRGKQPRIGAKIESPRQHQPTGYDTFDINTADTILLKQVYGIGSKLAARIIRFREALGGFVRPEQLNEVYGLDSLVVKRLLKVSFIKPGFVPMKINVNRADEAQLSAHPYVSYRMARAFVTFRYQHGDFHDVNDIKKLSMIAEEEIDRLLPYLKVTD